ncbi:MULTISPECIES: calcium:proton antiporter [unclassified Mesorhizobium]|uniref:calcium:proton antiporter n=1 Tax=unclassified Mesorhizobium TaxID=325217 RepID=UPI001FDEDCE7|nr:MULTISPECIES: ionic transporter [unclassified Mesorhizobium]
MAVHRRPIGQYLFPIGSLGLAALIHFGGASIEHSLLSIKILALIVVAIFIFATVFVVLHHAEAVARRLGEPYGTLLLTFSVTAIEASVIVSMMLHGANNPTLARESVFSTVMIVCTGVVGVCLTLGGLKHRYQDIKRQGTNASLAVIMALTVLTLILPNYTLATVPGAFSASQLAFVSVLSVLLYGAFVFAQMVRQRGDFIEDLTSRAEHEEHVSEGGKVTTNVLLLFVGLAGIVLLTEQVAGSIEDGLAFLQITQADAIVGFFVAALVLMPEAASAVRAALNNELQRGLNVALGSACATIGLTIPAIGAASLLTGRSLMLGLGPGDTVLLLLALAISIVSFGTGRTTMLTGLVHLVVFVAYLFLIFVP